MPLTEKQADSQLGRKFFQYFFQAGVGEAVAPNVGAWYTGGMRIIARKVLCEFWEHHPEAEAALKAWFHDVQHAQWVSPHDIRQVYATASIIEQHRVVFNIRGNQYRLVVAINYAYHVVYVRFVGTHHDYDRIDATTI